MSMLLSCCCQRLTPYADVPMLTDLTVGSGTRASGNYLNSGSRYANWGIATDEDPFTVTYTTELNLDTEVPGENPLGVDPGTLHGYKTAHPDNILRPRRLTGLRLLTGCYARIAQAGGGFIIGSTGDRLAGGRAPATYQVFIDGVAAGSVQTVGDDATPWNGGRLVFTPPVVTSASPYRQYHVSVVCTFAPRGVSSGDAYDRDIIPYGSSQLDAPSLQAGYDFEIAPFRVATTIAEPFFNSNLIYSLITADIYSSSFSATYKNVLTFWLPEGTAGRPIQSPWLGSPDLLTPQYGLYDGTTTQFFQWFQLSELSQLELRDPPLIRTVTESGTRLSWNPW